MNRHRKQVGALLIADMHDVFEPGSREQHRRCARAGEQCICCPRRRDTHVHCGKRLSEWNPRKLMRCHQRRLKAGLDAGDIAIRIG